MTCYDMTDMTDESNADEAAKGADADKAAEAVAISNRVKALMERHDVPKRAQAGRLSEILQLTFSAASRKMKGQLPWTTSQLIKVAEAFGEHVSVLVDMPASAAVESESTRYDAALFFGQEPETCTAWINDRQEIHRKDAGTYVARKLNEAWFVYRTTDAPEGGGPLYPVRLIEIRDSGPRVRLPNVAVLDDDKRDHSAENLAETLKARGFDAIPYTNDDDVRAALQTHLFDAFVLDWVLSPSKNAAALIRHIRSSGTASSDAAIFILTGKLKDGTASEDEIAKVQLEQRCYLIEKPVRPQSFAAELANAIDRR
ncbi:putative Response regulator receiver protein [Paraburkholderia tropica]|uniref:helix-turn-helix domain-containing protein n=1 Tax=Paraburkholderia tropica TaxID=92647 RepID=UPI001CAEE2EC|nr:helix-turn-helix domain-containing protein [Paraburkholderia tropica]CAG9235726.1 putative Response regulator receiver protein [Paraburkholderia tropica]